jgi:hypothetical protein
MDKRNGGEWASLSALPNNGREELAASARRLSCDGEIFELRPEQSGGTHYAWLSGPNQGYGFTTSALLPDAGPGRIDDEGHLANIQSFLSMIDPETGYIADD